MRKVGRPFGGNAAARDCSLFEGRFGESLHVPYWRQTLRDEAESGLAAAEIRHVVQQHKLRGSASLAPCPKGGVERIPDRGEKVKLSNLSRRPWLNGVRGEVLSAGADERGFVVLRLPSAGATRGDRPSQEIKKVHASHVQSMRPQSCPGIRSSEGLRKSWSSADFRRSAVAKRLEASGELSSGTTTMGSTRSNSSGVRFLAPPSPAHNRSCVNGCDMESVATVAFPLQLLEDSWDFTLRSSPSSPLRDTMPSFSTERFKKESYASDPHVSFTGLLAMGCANNPGGM